MADPPVPDFALSFQSWCTYHLQISQRRDGTWISSSIYLKKPCICILEYLGHMCCQDHVEVRKWLPGGGSFLPWHCTLSMFFTIYCNVKSCSPRLGVFIFSEGPCLHLILIAKWRGQHPMPGKKRNMGEWNRLCFPGLGPQRGKKREKGVTMKDWECAGAKRGEPPWTQRMWPRKLHVWT